MDKQLWNAKSYVMRYPRCMRKGLNFQILTIIVFITLFIVIVKQMYIIENGMEGFEKSRFLDSKEEPMVHFNRNIPIIWVGGVPRSGTTLARVMLDAHPKIRCGEETRVIPRIFYMHSQMFRAAIEQLRLKEAKISEDMLDDAVGAYVLTIIMKHGAQADNYCNKDPLTLRYINKLHKIFPKSKFILMIRDGRATVHSIITRKVSIRGFDYKTYAGALRDWNKSINLMYDSCLSVGEKFCLPVYYEQLVLHPKTQMKKILHFLGIEWNDNVIHHEMSIGKEGGASLSKREISTNQVVKPVNTIALTQWVDAYNDSLRSQMDELAPMLKKLGYDTNAYPPNYGTPDEDVYKQSQIVEAELQAEALQEANEDENEVQTHESDLKKPKQDGDHMN